MNVRIVTILILLITVIVSALGVVYTRHDSRGVAIHLGELESDRDALIAEWSRLQLEQAWLADAGQVEAKARDELGMQDPQDTRILVIRP